ncbi:50S ribosomal protein L25/general stress protein Ctc [Desulfatitalea alkaliphila]|uniref:Large ribosomal subunit protein bL25 n=1 Tax=Desulfatitalea alkaliphila TaxID=2929485 RepID=A0AA41UI74_9BACT|nr:50S ribosomal protein L25/general stress protein Ctc [Desulfatitalea alkaliphila]MCJ8500460.1 50S ribosomal protein L25/general stress protein Ctc [Desulfatitalea alkaliphila]
MDNIALSGETRTTKGNGPARAMRREGRVPGVLYGPKTEPVMLSLATRDLEDILKKGGLGRSVFDLKLDEGARTKTVMIKEMQTHPISRAFLHVDLYEVAMDRQIRVNVPVITTGKSAGVEEGGMLEIIRRELEVLCLPNQIPDSFTIDISDLGIGDSVHVEEIETGEGVEIPHDVNFTILTVASPQRAVEEEEAEEGEEGEAAEAEAGEETEESGDES